MYEIGDLSSSLRGHYPALYALWNAISIFFAPIYAIQSRTP